MKIAANIEEYMGMFTEDVQAKLQQMRAVILDICPEAEESIAYGMPAYKMFGKPLVYFAGHRKHIGFYAVPTTHEAFEAELAPYKRGKGSVQFPLDQELPLNLVRLMTEYRLKTLQNKNSNTTQTR
jgi:uncharacterized protein YdhG (YjbR/CyaY superfamily)